MRRARRFVAAALACSLSTSVLAAEGPSIAGPIGGTDIRSAAHPPPGLYAGGILFPVDAFDFADGHEQSIPALADAKLRRIVGGLLVGYVPKLEVFGGSIALLGVASYGRICGHLFASTPKSCQSGFGDPYVEASWSRFIGSLRPSRQKDALPITQGLAIALGFGAVVPIGQYDSTDPTTRALSNGNNIWVFAPNLALTYTTPPIFAEGTEFSTKIYWNKYRTNPATQYSTGDLINIDFAVSERLGRFQAGAAGFYARQVSDDRLYGIPVPPEGQRARLLNVGPVVAYDMPEHGAFVKIKALSTVLVRNSAHSRGVVFSLLKKLN